MSFSELYFDYLKKQRRKQNVVGKFFIFSVFSAIAGATIAFFTAPKSGKENRKDFANATRKASNRIVKTAVEWEKEGEETFRDLKSKAEKRFSELQSELTDKVQSLKKKLGEEEVVEKLKTKRAPSKKKSN